MFSFILRWIIALKLLFWVFKPKEFNAAVPARFLIYGLDQKLSQVYVNTDVEILCSDWNNLEIINCMKILAAKSVDRVSAPPDKDERKDMF